MQYSPLRDHSLFKFSRDQQINEVLTVLPGSTSLAADRSLLEIPFALSNGQPAAIRVSLPPAFPRNRPALSLTTPLQHPWVDPAGQINPPDIEQWGQVPDVRLAALLQQAITALSAARPQPSSAAMKLPFFNNDRREAQAAATPAAQGQAGPSAAAPPLPRIPPAFEFPQIATMPVVQMERTLQEQVDYEKLLARVAADARERGTTGGPALAALRRDNADLARANLAKESELAEVRNQIAIVRTTEYDAAIAEFEERFARQEKAREQIAPERLIERLHQSAQGLEAGSRTLERRLQGGELRVEDFVRQYLDIRTQYHTQDLKYHAALQTIPTNTPVLPLPPPA